MSDDTPPGSTQEKLEILFQALPPLGTPEYLGYLRQADRQELPPEVLVRAYRQLAAAGHDDAAQQTLARLFRRRGNEYAYLNHLHYYAKQHIPPNQHWQDEEDLLQDAIRQILITIPTERGGLAEYAWITFCKQRLDDAWRARQGRRGERCEPLRAEPRIDEETGGEVDPVERQADLPPWHGNIELNDTDAKWLYSWIEKTVAQIADPLTRQIAYDQWLSGDPSPVSGEKCSFLHNKPALTEQLGISRDRINRALDAARAQVLVALLTQQEKEIDQEQIKRELHKRSPLWKRIQNLSKSCASG